MSKVVCFFLVVLTQVLIVWLHDLTVALVLRLDLFLVLLFICIPSLLFLSWFPLGSDIHVLHELVELRLFVLFPLLDALPLHALQVRLVLFEELLTSRSNGLVERIDALSRRR